MGGVLCGPQELCRPASWGNTGGPAAWQPGLEPRLAAFGAPIRDPFGTQFPEGGPPVGDRAPDALLQTYIRPISKLRSAVLGGLTQPRLGCWSLSQGANL